MVPSLAVLPAFDAEVTASPFRRAGAAVTRQKEPLPTSSIARRARGDRATLEQGELPLEESLRQFERGVALTRLCQEALTRAERKIRVLAKGRGGELREQDFEAVDAD